MRATRVVAVVVLAWAAIATFPFPYRLVVPGIDDSWRWALNDLAHAGGRFGRDVVFTWGPLGWLVNPMPIGNHVLLADLAWLLMHAATFVAAYVLWRRHRRPVALIAFAIAEVWAVAVDPDRLYELRPVLLGGMLLLLRDGDGRLGRVGPTIGAVILGAAWFVKFTSGAAGATVMIGALAAWLLTEGMGGLRRAVTLLLTYQLTVALLGIVLTGSAGNLARWGRLSIDLAAGYPVAMSSPVKAAAVTAGVLALIAVAGVSIWLVGRRAAAGAAALTFVGAGALTFRQGYVRHQGRLLFPVLLAALGIVMLCARRPRELLAAGLATVLVGSFGSWGADNDTALRGRFYDHDLMTGERGWDAFWDSVDPGGIRDDFQRRSAGLLAPVRLQPSLIDELRRDRRGVDVLPLELSYLAANRLPWNPAPLLQSYTAYSPTMDREMAAHFRGEDRPGHVLVDFLEIDERHPMATTPITWRALLDGYRLEHNRPGAPMVFEARRPGGARLHPIGRTTAKVGRWQQVPRREGWVVGALDFDLTTAGRRRALLWRVPRVTLEVRWAGGAKARYRLIASTAGGGLFLNPLPRDRPELVRILRGEEVEPIAAFRITGGGADSYDAEVRVSWYELPRPAPVR